MAGIIKSGQQMPTPQTAQPVAFDLDDIRHQADACLAQARQQAAQIVQQAKKQASRVIRVAQQQGQQVAVEQAKQSAEAKLSEQLQTLMPALRQAIDSIHQAKDAWRQDWQSKAVQLAVAIAQRVIRRELSRQPEITLDLVREALELATGNNRIRLHLSPQDHATLGDQVARLVEQLSTLGEAEVIPDPNVAPGGCLVQTEFGKIDLQIQSQLQRIEEELN